MPSFRVVWVDGFSDSRMSFDGVAHSGVANSPMAMEAIDIRAVSLLINLCCQDK